MEDGTIDIMHVYSIICGWSTADFYVWNIP